MRFISCTEAWAVTLLALTGCDASTVFVRNMAGTPVPSTATPVADTVVPALAELPSGADLVTRYGEVQAGLDEADGNVARVAIAALLKTPDWTLDDKARSVAWLLEGLSAEPGRATDISQATLEILRIAGPRAPVLFEALADSDATLVRDLATHLSQGVAVSFWLSLAAGIRNFPSPERAHLGALLIEMETLDHVEISRALLSRLSLTPAARENTLALARSLRDFVKRGRLATNDLDTLSQTLRSPASGIVAFPSSLVPTPLQENDSSTVVLSTEELSLPGKGSGIFSWELPATGTPCDPAAFGVATLHPLSGELSFAPLAARTGSCDLLLVFNDGIERATKKVTLNILPRGLSALLLPATATRATPHLTCRSGDAPRIGRTYEVQWRRNGTPLGPWSAAGSSGESTLTSEEFSKGQSLACAVRPVEAAGTGAEVVSTTLVIGNAVPTLAPGGNDFETHRNETRILTFASAHDPDEDALRYEIVTPPSHGSLSGLSATGATYAPETDEMEPAIFSYRICERDAPTACSGVREAHITLLQDDAPPTLADIADQVTTEEVAKDVALGIDTHLENDVQCGPAFISVTATNPALVASITLTGTTAADCGLRIRPAEDRTGATPVTVTVRDANGRSDTKTFTLTITAVNDAPELAPLTNETTTEDVARTIALSLSDHGESDLSCAAPKLTATSDNTTLLPNASITFAGAFPACTLTMSPAPNKNGTAHVTVVANDGTQSATRAFSLTVAPQNDAPSLPDLPSQSTSEDTPKVVAVTLEDWGEGDLACSATQIAVTSSNEALLPSSQIAVGGTFPNCNLTLTPANNRFGTASITLVVSDEFLATSDTFDLVVTPSNDPPTLSAITAQTMNEDTSLAVPFSLDDKGDGDLACTAAKVTATSSNATLLPNSNLTVSGVFPHCFLNLAPAADRTGTSTLTVTVSDGSLTAQTTFTVTVSNQNDAPVFAASIADQTTAEDTAKIVGFTLNDKYENDLACTSARISVSSSHATVLAPAGIAVGGTFPNCTLTLAPVANGFGTSVVEVVVSDGTLSTADLFAFTVTPVNDAPLPGVVSNQATLEDVPIDVTLSIDDRGEGDVACHAANVQVTSSNTTLLPNAAISVLGALPSCTIRLIPAANRSGTTTLTILVTDGALTSTQTPTLTVSPVNDAPSLSVASSLTVSEDSPVVVNFLVDDRLDGDLACNTTSLTASSSNTTLVPNSAFAIGGSFPACTLSFAPGANIWGTSNITVTLSDGSLSDNATLALTVTAVNDPPALAAGIPAQATSEDSVKVVSLTLDDKGENDLQCSHPKVSVGSSNTALVAPGGLAVAGTFPNCTLTLTPIANQSGTTTIVVELSDGTSTTQHSFVLTVNAVNDAPSDIALSGNVAIEHELPAATVGSLTATDLDAADTHTFTLPVGVGDNASFAIAGNTLRMIADADPLTLKTSYSITVRTQDTDNASFEKTFTVNLGVETSLLMPLAGKTGDLSLYHHTVNGTAQYDASRFPNGMVAWFDGTRALSIAKHTSLEMGTNDFTIEIHFAGATDNPGSARALRLGGWNSTVPGIEIYCDATGKIGIVRGYGTTTDTASWETLAPSCRDNSWHHLALVRRNGVLTVFGDGVHLINRPDTYDYALNESLFVGAQTNAANRWKGWLTDVRVTKGHARYESNFTPRALLRSRFTHPDPYGDSLQLALPFGIHDRVSDVAARIRGTGLTKNLAGALVSYSAESKFYGMSYAFNGTNTYVKYPHHETLSMGTADMTIEAWVRPSVNKDQIIVQKSGACGAYWSNYALQLTAAGNLHAGVYQSVAAGTTPPSVGILSTAQVPLNAWSHVAMVREGSSLRIYINGTLAGSTTFSFSPDDPLARPITIGMDDVERTCGSKYFQGNMQDVRIYRGVAKYDANFTPPGAMRIGLGIDSATPATSGQQIFDDHPIAESGNYWFKPAGFASATPVYFDMETQDGPWMMVLNYVHAANTNPTLDPRTNSFPLMGYGDLGGNESTYGGALGVWGHALPSLLNQLTFTRFRFYGATNCHARVIDFWSSLAGGITYMKTGTGSFTGLAGSFTALPGHTSTIPGVADSYFSNRGDGVLTEFPFYKTSSAHWGIRGAGTNRWEVDNWDQGTGYACSTIHRVFVK